MKLINVRVQDSPVNTIYITCPKEIARQISDWAYDKEWCIKVDTSPGCIGLQLLSHLTQDDRAQIVDVINKYWQEDVPLYLDPPSKQKV